jgi:acetyl-CoA C-acetyltransferase
MMPELFLADAWAQGKPLFRVHTAGSVGGSTAIVAASHIESGIHQRVLTVGWQKQSESEAMWALSFPSRSSSSCTRVPAATSPPTSAATSRRAKAPDDIGILVALKDRQNALRTPTPTCTSPRSASTPSRSR